DQAKSKAAEHGIPLYFTSVEEMIRSSDIDAVFIASANSQHHSETVIAAEHGKHVLVEKPMSVTYSEASDMVQACKMSGVKFMVGHMLRFSPLLRRMKEIVDRKTIGEITFARADFIYDARNSKRGWLWNKETAGGGPLYDIGIHCLDSLRYVLDDEVKNVTAMRRGFDETKVESTSLLSLQFSKGPLGSVYSSFEAGYRQTYIEFQGTAGSVSAFNFTPSRTHSVIETKIGKDGSIGDVQKEEIDVPDLYELELSHFSDCILHNTEPLITAESALHNQFVLEQAVRQK
ncbi:MAG: Gfo/Idh/MocA family oxidoreductase, partial [Bacteroidota bacterium]